MNHIKRESQSILRSEWNPLIICNAKMKRLNAIVFDEQKEYVIHVLVSGNFLAGFKTLSFSQPIYSLFTADEGTNFETAGRITIENVYVGLNLFKVCEKAMSE